MKRKAQFKILEAALASILLIIFLAWSFGFTYRIPETESLELKLKVLKTLKAIDQNDELRKYVYSNNTTAIEQKLYPHIPRNFDFKVLICEDSCSYSLEAKKVYSISYFLSSDLKKFSSREVMVYVWEM